MKSKKKESVSWLRSAEKDLATARYLFKGRKYDTSAFFCQQCVEKAMKAILIDKSKQMIKTHDLVYLAQEVNLPLDMVQHCKELTMVYVAARYPDIPELRLKRERARIFLKFSKEVLEWAKKQI